ncbi:MAG TPA: hypothetical protein VMU58_09420 [Gaiellaceae bacterium]|nr:hypothetical protein [Gaiellaceae bacterium]
MSVTVLQLVRRLSVLQRLQAAALAGYGLVSLALFAYGRPGTGISQGFYVPIVLAALAAGPATGAAAGFLATVLYELVLYRDGSGGVTELVGMHLLWYVAAGVVVGYFARRGRAMLAEALGTLEDLLRLARRDLGTGAHDADGLQQALAGRIAAGRPFGLLVGELECEGDDPDAQLRSAIAAIAHELDGATEVARIGPTQLALLVAASSARAVARDSAAVERLLDARGGSATFGWALYPGEGDDALSLFRSASERLYARRVVRGEWTPTAASAGLVDEIGLAP